jgi:hypothetical protein
LRPGALLHVIVVSDEEEQSGAAPSYWVNRFEGHVAHPSLLKVSAVADINTACGDHSGAANYKTAANLTGGEKLNVCTSAWSSQTATLALASLSAINEYTLTTTAEPSSVDVSVNGTQWNSGWTFDASTNSVIFTSSPPTGASVVVNYLPAGASGTFTLGAPANPSTVQVFVDGTRWNSGWYYDSNSASVVFTSQMTPGSLVEVSYVSDSAGTTFPLSGTNIDELSITVYVNGQLLNAGWTYDPSTISVIFDLPVNTSANIEISYGEFGEC